MLIRKKFLFLGVALIAFSTSFSAESNQEIEVLKSRIAEYEGVVKTHLNRLNICREQCVANCKASCPYDDMGNFQARQDCLAGCTNEKCDAGSCHSQKQSYDKWKETLDGYKSNLGVAEGQTREEGEADESATEKINRAKRKTNTMAYLGAAATSFLIYKAIACCSKSPACGMCWQWSGMAGLAGLQTKMMFEQRDDFGETERGLCSNDPSNPLCQSHCSQNPQDPACDSSCTGGADNPPHCQAYCVQNPHDCEPPPSCTETVPGQNICDPFLDIVDPKDPKIPPDPNEPPKPPPVCASGTDCFAGTDPLIPDIFKQIKPNNDWPDGMPKKILDEDWLDENISPKQKKKIDRMLANMRKQNKAYMDKAGLTDEELRASGAIEAGEASFSGERVSSVPGANAFSGSKDSETSSYAGNEPSGVRKQAGAGKNLLAKQMQDMLKKFRDKNSGVKGSLKGKSVNFGDDIVGVAEDNIFMMAHRRHRNLDEDRNIFIRKGF